MAYRIGIGYDIHRLVKGRKLVIGGVVIPYSKGLLGHSDADVLAHAICDALLGACACGDIGEHFPDTDPKYKGIYSIELLKNIATILKKRRYSINNIDTVVILQEPKLAAFKDKIRKTVASALKIKESCFSMKAKTNEGLGEIGNKKAIAAYAVALVVKED